MADEKSFKNTLNLPHTDFPIRPNAKIDDPIMLERWESEGLCQKAMDIHAGKVQYILHDGPPYANGNIHLGHAYNKILKDIVTKAHRMMGFHVPVIPGWDCHGLPIELAVTKEHPEAQGQELQKACREYALRWVNTQKEQFKQLGVLMDWERPYITMDPSYESYTMQAFGKLVGKKLIERKLKTVAWCAHCKTVLASAEIEYKDRKDPSIFVTFPLGQENVKKLFPNVDTNNKPVSLLIWTTTPWTLPLNRAVVLRNKADYALAKLGDYFVVVGKDCVERIANDTGLEAEILATVVAEDFDGMRVNHPFVENLDVPILLDASVGLDEGTACVHSAPGCGPIDYEIAVKHGIEVFSPLSADGKYTQGIMPQELENMPVSDGQIWVLRKLKEKDALVHKSSIRHSYPHCWRCRNGLMFRATKQWFFKLDSIKDKALKAIEHITFSPKQGKNFLRATVENRWEWCLSRQRVWGVPIPALLCSCNYAYCTPEFVERVAEHVKQEGVEYWTRVTIQDLIKDGALDKDFVCPNCSAKVESFKKESDILDVWFDSGISHYAVLNHRKDARFPADLYCEGIDQHRGWFQSSLLTSMALEGSACTLGIMTHGFTVDGKGQKMSKSLGNVVAPQEIINKLGTDGLRLWVASIGNDGDAVVSDVLLKNVAQVYRKVRNTCRFMLQNLYDFDYTKDAQKYDELHDLDKYALAALHELDERIRKAYKAGDMTAVFHALGDYCSGELSSFYLDIIKDRLYCDKATGKDRRCAQTVVWHILDALTKLMAPILSFTAEHLSDYYQKDKKDSIHLQLFVVLSSVCKEADLAVWQNVKRARSEILKALESLREKGSIKHSLDSRVTVYVDPKEKNAPKLKQLLNKQLLIVSQFVWADNSDGLEKTDIPGLFVSVEPARGSKCPRCWQWDENPDTDGLCPRCHGVV